MRLFTELRRRNVLRMAVLYVVAAWLVMQVAEVVIGLANLPASTGPWTLALLALGFPIALLFSWFYEITPEGFALEKDAPKGQSITQATGRRMDFVIIAVLCAGLILFAWDKWYPSGPMENSIAVLPFENLSGDPEQDYFSDGISEEILNLLAQTQPLKVIARTSSFSFKGKDVDVATIAHRLNVSHVLEGSIRRDDHRVRVTAQLIDARDSTHLWSQTFERDVGDVFALQDEVALAVRDVMRSRLKVGEDALTKYQARPARAVDAEAYELYLRGLDKLRQRRTGEAINLFAQAAERDEHFGNAQVGIAMCLTLWASYGFMDVDKTLLEAAQALALAEENGADAADVYATRGLIAGLTGDTESEIEYQRKALSLNPSHGDALNWQYSALSGAGRYAEAKVAMQQMLAVDPLSVIGRYNYVEWLSQQRRFDEAHAVADELIRDGHYLGYYAHARNSWRFEGDFADGFRWYLARALAGRDANEPTINLGFETAICLALLGEFAEARRVGESSFPVLDLMEGRIDDAVETARDLLVSHPGSAYVAHTAAMTLYYAGEWDAAQAVLTNLLDERGGRPIEARYYDGESVGSMVPTARLALVLHWRGQQEGAMEVAELARRELSAQRASGTVTRFQFEADALLAQLDGDAEKALHALESAFTHGSTDPLFYRDPAFENIRQDPRFVTMLQKLAENLRLQRTKVLQLMCVDNPARDYWQPLPATCEAFLGQET